MNRDNTPSPCPFCANVYEWGRGLRKHLKNHHVEKQEQNTSAIEKTEVNQ
jgi:hypothetical protein